MSNCSGWSVVVVAALVVVVARTPYGDRSGTGAGAASRRRVGDGCPGRDQGRRVRCRGRRAGGSRTFP